MYQNVQLSITSRPKTDILNVTVLKRYVIIWSYTLSRVVRVSAHSVQ